MATVGIPEAAHGIQPPSEWVRRWATLIPAGGEVLDLACGGGRHGIYLASCGYRVCAVNRDAQAIRGLAGVAGINALVADLECGRWPFDGRRFAGVIVTNYLHRPLFPRIIGAIMASGVLIYETFAVGNERFGRPTNPDFLLRAGELLDVARGQLRVVAFEDLQADTPKPAMVQRICAVRTQPEA